MSITELQMQIVSNAVCGFIVGNNRCGNDAWTLYDSTCFTVFDLPMRDFASSMSLCNSFGAVLASVTSLAVKELILELITDSPGRICTCKVMKLNHHVNTILRIWIWYFIYCQLFLH